MIKNMVRYVILSFCLGSMIACTQGAGTDASAPPKIETEDEKTLYALGLLLGRNIKSFGLKPEELTIVKAGLTDAVTDAKPQVEIETYGPKVNELAQKRAAAGADDAKKKGQEFADTVAKEKDATKTASGVVIRTITPGAGASPTAADVVKVHYEGKLIDGTVFDSSIQRGEPVEFPLGWCRALLDGSAAEDEERREGASGMSGIGGIWRSRLPAGYPPWRHAQLRSGAD